jgi:transcriptional regulator with XRE-family HTH domain
MKTLGERIQALRKQHNLTQLDLATKVKISLTQMVRYEANKVQPPADVLKKISDVLNASIDFLVNGDKDGRFKNSLKDIELMNQFKAVEAMNDKDRAIVKELIDAFVTKRQLQKMVK